MKCRVCGQPANIKLRAYNTALCTKDFILFLEKRVLNTIQTYHLINENDRPVVAVSGGKDSLSLWYMLDKLGFDTNGIYIHLGIGQYSETSLEKVKKMADAIRKTVHIFHFHDAFNRGIEELSKIIRRPVCSACGMVKRYIMNRICIEKDYTCLLTGHNLDDEASALLGNVLYWKQEYLWKKNVLLEGTEGHLSSKTKPFFLCSEREIAAYAIMNGIDYIYDECPYSYKAKSILYKHVLNTIELKSPGTKLQFIKGYLKMAKDSKKEDNFCKLCGYPSFGDICNYCRLTERFGTGNEIHFDTYNGTGSVSIDDESGTPSG